MAIGVTSRGVRKWEFPFHIFFMGIPWEWEWTTCNLGSKGMGMGIVTWEWEGTGMGECGKIPVPHSTDTDEQTPL